MFWLFCLKVFFVNIFLDFKKNFGKVNNMKKVKLLVLFLPIALVSGLDSKPEFFSRAKKYSAKKTEEIIAFAQKHKIACSLGGLGAIIGSVLTYLHFNKKTPANTPRKSSKATANNSRTFSARVFATPANGKKPRSKYEVISLRRHYFRNEFEVLPVNSGFYNDTKNQAYGVFRWIVRYNNQCATADVIDLKNNQVHELIEDHRGKFNCSRCKKVCYAKKAFDSFCITKH